jgi:hypothetical protein|tara:strand:- start:6223 stop:7284 length:1062 start_codon:yes stop_codon:yes gene_type:complete
MGLGHSIIRYAFVPILCGVFGVILLTESLVDKTFSELALNKETTSVFHSDAGKKVHCGMGDDILGCVDGRSIDLLWLGNSQLHAINQIQDGIDKTALAELYEHYRPLGLNVIGLSQPNASLLEHQHILNYVLSKSDVGYLILPLVYDDTREGGVRKGLLPEDVSLQGQSENDSDINNKNILKPDELRKSVENFLNETISGFIPIWAERSRVKAEIYSIAYKMRNFLLGIEPTSVRKKLLGPYKNNLRALNEMMETLERLQIPSLVYIAPIRSDIKLPYDIDDYMEFKESARRSLNKFSFAKYANFEHIVDNSLWGYKESTNLKPSAEVDFMHFQGPGHIILSEKVMEFMKNDI